MRKIDTAISRANADYLQDAINTSTIVKERANRTKRASDFNLKLILTVALIVAVAIGAWLLVLFGMRNLPNGENSDQSGTPAAGTDTETADESEEETYAYKNDFEKYQEDASRFYDPGNTLGLDKNGQPINDKTDFASCNEKLENSEAYSYTSFCNALRTLSYVNSTVDQITYGSLYEYNWRFPVRSVKVINETGIVVQYKLDNDGEIIYAYLVFEHDGTEKDLSTDKNWLYTGEHYFFRSGVLFEEINNFEPGDKISVAKCSELFGKDTAMSLCLQKKDVVNFFVAPDGIKMLTLSMNSCDESGVVDPDDLVIVSDVAFYGFGEEVDGAEETSMTGRGGNRKRIGELKIFSYNNLIEFPE